MPISLEQRAYVAQVVPYVPPVDTDPPSLRLFQLPGDSTVSPAQPGPHILESWVTAGHHQVYTDPGWEAVDAVDGNVTADVSALGLSLVRAAVSTETPTEEESPIVVRYQVSDAAGNTAMAVRLVHVACPADQQPCTSAEGTLACGFGGMCSVTTATAAVEAAVVTLMGPDVVLVPQGVLPSFG